MKTDFSRPQVETAGTRNPIRVDRGDTRPLAPNPYLARFEQAMELAFLLAFRRAEHRGGA